jgi:hypothetical protein
MNLTFRSRLALHVLKILTWIFEKKPAVVKFLKINRSSNVRNSWLTQNITKLSIIYKLTGITGQEGGLLYNKDRKGKDQVYGQDRVIIKGQGQEE